MARSYAQEIGCRCGGSLILWKERLPKGYYYSPMRGDCPVCETHYELSPTGHLYIADIYSGRFDELLCAEDNGELEKVIHVFRNFWGQKRWETVVYCPRHEEHPSSFLSGIYEYQEPSIEDLMAGFLAGISKGRRR